MALLFAATIFLSALLLFWIQLVMAKMLLPRLGGTPAVWTTCMLFFQVMLLAGYYEVLVTTSRLGVRKQAILHGAVLLLSCLYLPLTFAGNPGSISETSHPALWLFVYLMGAIGFPVFLISTTSPLLQKWFTHTGSPSANDPYFLFAVSNGGSVGDARLKLQNARDNHYGLIVLDAFNSDAIPIHLMTQEAIALYTSKLATGGMLAFHVSNRSLKLDAVLADLAKRSDSISLRAVDGEHNPVTGKDPSEWVVIARSSPAFDTLAQNLNWRRLQGPTESIAWTDDFSNILSVFRWY